MRQFSNSSATILRQVYVLNVSSFTTVGSVSGYLRSLDPETASQNGFQYGYGFSFIADFGTDIRIGDKLSINAVLYDVKGITQNGIAQSATSYMKALVTKPE